MNGDDWCDAIVKACIITMPTVLILGSVLAGIHEHQQEVAREARRPKESSVQWHVETLTRMAHLQSQMTPRFMSKSELVRQQMVRNEYNHLSHRLAVVSMRSLGGSQYRAAEGFFREH